jgi:hypothetical protein
MKSKYHTFVAVRTIFSHHPNIMNNMKTTIRFSMMAAVATFLCATLFSCKYINPKQYALDQHRKICEEIILNGENCTDEVWETYKTKHLQVSDNLSQYKADYTPEELNEVGRLEGKVSKVYLKREASDTFKGLYDGVKDLIDEGAGFLEGLSQ